MILRDFHIHSLFSDGNDDCESIVRSAIERGIRTVGFAEHSDPQTTDLYLPPERKEAYISELSRLKEKYEGRIEIFCGIELDLFTPYEEDERIDYIIGSVHYIEHKGELYPVDLSAADMQKTVNDIFGGDFSSYAEAYFECAARLKEGRRADIIGHFDLLTKFKDRGVSPDQRAARYINAYRSALEELGKETVFEVNTGAISRGYREKPYPDGDIIAEMVKRGCSFILSSDSHSKENICFGFESAQKLLSSYGAVLKEYPF